MGKSLENLKKYERRIQKGKFSQGVSNFTLGLYSMEKFCSKKYQNDSEK